MAKGHSTTRQESRESAAGCCPSRSLREKPLGFACANPRILGGKIGISGGWEYRERQLMTAWREEWNSNSWLRLRDIRVTFALFVR
jgi:hypothetical protein